MNRPRNLREDEAVKAVTLINEGYSQRYVANLLGVTQSTISRTFKRFNELGSYSRTPGQGRKKSTNARDERYLVNTSLRNRRFTSSELSRALAAARNVIVSARTVRRRLNEGRLHSRRPATAPLLTREHRVMRLRFAREHVNWTIDNWKRVLFSDETRVSLNSPDGRQRVWRRPGERFASCNISPRIPFFGGSIMFWGGICFEGRTDLVPIRGRSMNADFYVENILEEHVMPFAPFVGDNFIFMQDNARPHVARQVMDYLQFVNIEAMGWPPRSPDMNPIEHLWDSLKRAVRRHIPAPTNLRELEHVVLAEWQNIPQETIQNLIRSMPRRMEAVIRARGGPTRY